MSTLKNVKNTTNPVRKKISVNRIKLSEQTEGFTFQGIFRGVVLSAPFSDIDKKTGEVITKQLSSVVFENADGERVAYLADKGLLDNLSTAQVQEGHMIEVVKMPKVLISKGRTMNQYDIYSIDSFVWV